MIKNPVRGMRDILPNDLSLREYLLDIITRGAAAAGYHKIETPMMEHLENLTSKDGGENETLIFKVLKRGRDLEKAKASGDELSDSALRYDLTVPLARFYAAHTTELPAPFKTLQIGPVWRADAPQKGRYRQFTQCDMDILGDSTILAEIDSINTVLTILSEICEKAKLTGLTVHLNDRRILSAAAAYAGFKEEDYGAVLIALDKNDKIGLEGVKKELLKLDYPEDVVDKFIKLFEDVSEDTQISSFCAQLGEFAPEDEVIDDLSVIMDSVETGAGRIIFDPTLVRGMGYYTGPIYECTADGLGSSIAGGGRYDKMIGKFSGQDVAACGFSIGFERLLTILDDLGFKPEMKQESCAILVSKKVPKSDYQDIVKRAAKMREEGQTVSVLPMARNLGRQIRTLEETGYTKIEKIYGD